MKNLFINLNKIVKEKQALIINDDSLLNNLIFQQIIYYFETNQKEIKIVYFSCLHYFQLGIASNIIIDYLKNQIQSLINKFKQLVILIDGGEFLNLNKFNFPLKENVFVYCICSSFVFYNKQNMYFHLLPKFYVEPKNLVSFNEAKLNLQNFLYDYCVQSYDLKNLNQIEKDWFCLIENLISIQKQNVESKKLSSDILRKLLAEIALQPLGLFQIGIFCEKNDFRYESVVLALNYLTNIGLIYEIKLMLKNDIHSRKKNSLFFIKPVFVYSYYQSVISNQNLKFNLIFSQFLTDLINYLNFENLNLTYKVQQLQESWIYSITVGWHNLQIEHHFVNKTFSLKVNNDLINKIYGLENEVNKNGLMLLKNRNINLHKYLIKLILVKV